VTILERVEQMLTALEKGQGTYCCPSCGEYEHEADCALAALLADVRQEIKAEQRNVAMNAMLQDAIALWVAEHPE